ncbi:TPA: AAA family ATPase, partial [Yersinia enterocolitica]|nr:AAA family ATPase [Yersinia enterocolitica]
QKSLFHLSMTIAMIRLESELRKEKYKTLYEAEIVNMPALTIVALEEPENCLSPFYLSKILQQLREVTSELNVQSVVSSHSSSILTRIDPEAIRYFKLNINKQTEVKEILLPPNTDEARKYVKEAVKAYPELYFSRLVIFGEGDSEEIILPRLAESKGILLDPAFIAVVPLGGRHVNHFWRLVNDLNIPHITLLDLDKGRSGGGWGRIKYVIEQLVALGNPVNKYISEANGTPAQQSLDKMHLWTDYTNMDGFCTSFETINIFFSSPLDIDWAMLHSFSDEYRGLEKNQKGPQSTIDGAKQSVLKTNGDMALYPDSENENFQWYNYLFLGRGKPATHLNALSKIENSRLLSSMPQELERLLNRVNKIIVTLDPEGEAK